MNNFNKLYNLILESIITQNKATRRKMLEATFSDQQNITYVQKFLDSLNNNKAADFLCKYFCTGQLIDTDDPLIDKVLSILKRNTSFDTQKDISLDQFIKQNQKYLNRDQFKNKNINLDKIKVFSEKRTFDKGVVVYKVQQSKEAQRVVRKIIDAQWGDDADPWCLAAGHGQALDDHYRQHWMYYTAYPKHIAFQNGQLLAFCASAGSNVEWWDRQDHSTNYLVLLDGSQMQIEIPQFTREEQIKIFVQKKHLIYNKETGRYDCNWNLEISDNELIDGEIPVPLGEISGSFEAIRCYHLKSLKNGPVNVHGGYNIIYCKSLTSLDGLAKWIDDYLAIDHCINLEDISAIDDCEMKHPNISKHGCKKLLSKQEIIEEFIESNRLNYNQATKLYDCTHEVVLADEDLIDGYIPVPFGRVFDSFYVSNCVTLKSLKNSPKYVRRGFYCKGCTALTSFEGCPENLEGNFYAQGCTNVTTLKGTQNLDKETMYFDNCPKIPNEERKQFFLDKNKRRVELDPETGKYNSKGSIYIGNEQIIDGHFPVKFGKVLGNFKCFETDLITLQGAPEEVTEDFNCTHCLKLKNLVGGPKKVGENYSCAQCYGLQSFEGIAKEIGYSFIADHCSALKEIKEAPRVINGAYRVKNCKALTSLVGSPQIVKGDCEFNWDENLQSLQGCPREISGDFNINHCFKLKSFEHGPQKVGLRYFAMNCVSVKSKAGLQKTKVQKGIWLPDQLKENKDE